MHRVCLEAEVTEATGPSAITITKYGRYTATQVSAEGTPTPDEEVEILARIKANLTAAPLAGFVCEACRPSRWPTRRGTRP